ncbi:tail fiber domain-containing protein, partial [Acetobacter pasteurianus]
MATTYGAPTNLDLSACSVTATGGTASQTLADLGKAVGDNAAAVATANSNASTANTNAQAAQTDAAAAKAAVDGLGDTYVAKTSVGVANGVAGLAADSSLVVPCTADNNENPVLSFGYGTNTIGTGGSVRVIYNGTVGTMQDYLNWSNPDGSATFGRYLDGTVLTGRSSGSLNIGVAAQPVNTVYSHNAAVVTSDASAKTIAGLLTDTSYADGQKLVAALATVKPTVYQLNASIAEKGAAAARYHVGYIAQDVEAAITAAGLDPSKFALWTKTALFTVTENTDGTLKQTATVDTSGNQQYIQMLRYE